MTDDDIDPINMLTAFNDVLPIKSALPKDGKENRRAIRYKVTWGIVISIEGHDPYDGKIKDISVYGAAILNGLNLKPNTSITLHINIPTLTNHGKPRIIKVQGKTSYSIHDDKHRCFKVGIAFVEFGLASDRAYLEARLSNHHIEA